MKTIRFFWIGIVLLAFFLPVGLKANQISTEDGSGIKIDVTSVFEKIPYVNSAPIRVRIQNHSDQNGNWRFSFGQQWRSSGTIVKEFQVEAGQTRTFQVTVPLFQSQRHRNFFVRAEGLGINGSADAHFPEMSTSYGASGTMGATLALSTDLAARSLGPLEKLASDQKKTLYATSFDPANFSDDWRALTGFEWLVFSETEWAKLAPGVRTAVRQWVGAGGHLAIAAIDPSRVSWSGFQFTQPESKRYGYGDVCTIPWDGKEVGVSVLHNLIKGETFVDRAAQSIHPEWPLFPDIGKFTPPKFMVVSAVIGLAVMLGPINFFWLAPASRRQRLFWTTPLLSLAGTLVLFALIFLKDGVGGYGGRVTVLRLLPGANEAVLYQNQMARTGLLLSSSFTVDDQALMHPVNLDGLGSNRDGQKLSGNLYHGGWFRSRSVQAQRIAEVRPTRAAIQKVGTAPSGAPEVVSSFETTVEELYVRDENDRLWSGKNLATGEKRTLEPADAKSANFWWNETIKPITGEVGRMLLKDDGVWSVPGTFRAKLAPGNLPVETFRSIRWKDDRVIALGPIESAKGEQQP